uniref:7TM_GPCR_Srx domain-containing protein n=1 Tax=Panagrellus redivivus TaxID=6233 RepID=A0A7E4UTM6_PANRE
MAAQPAPGWIAAAAGSALPVLFLEARVQGTTHHLITQMGVSIDADQCSVGVFFCTFGNWLRSLFVILFHGFITVVFLRRKLSGVTCTCHMSLTLTLKTYTNPKACR